MLPIAGLLRLASLLASIVALPAPATAPATNRSSQIQLPNRAAISAVKEQARRFGWRLESFRKPSDEQDYGLAREAFDVVVPAQYRGEPGWGLLVWVSPSGRGAAPRAWVDTLAKHKLIWIGAENSGNERAVWIRVGLAVDAAADMQQRYKIEPTRVYVSGMSGGGRVASMIGLAYADVFA